MVPHEKPDLAKGQIGRKGEICERRNARSGIGNERLSIKRAVRAARIARNGPLQRLITHKPFPAYLSIIAPLTLVIWAGLRE